MSSSLLERARGFHEDLEIYEREIIEQLEKKPRTQKVGPAGSPEEQRQVDAYLARRSSPPTTRGAAPSYSRVPAWATN